MLSTHFKKYLLLLLISPIFIWLAIKPAPIIKSWLQFPKYLIENIKSNERSKYLVYVYDLRWGGRGEHRNSFLSKIYYNPLSLVTKEIMEYFQYLTPRLYFLTGDGTKLSPTHIEPLPFLLFPFALFGLFKAITQKKAKLVFIFILSVLPGYLAGQRNFAYLFPCLFIYVYLSLLGIINLPLKYQKPILIVTFFYGCYLWSNLIWQITQL